MFQKALKTGEGQRSKGTLSSTYDFNVHCYVGHLSLLRRVHARNPPKEVEVTTSSGTKTKTVVKASDPLPVNGALYYYHSKIKMYGDWFFGPGTSVGSNQSKCPAHVQYQHNGAGFHLGL